MRLVYGRVTTMCGQYTEQDVSGSCWRHDRSCWYVRDATAPGARRPNAGAQPRSGPGPSEWGAVSPRMDGAQSVLRGSLRLKSATLWCLQHRRQETPAIVLSAPPAESSLLSVGLLRPTDASTCRT